MNTDTGTTTASTPAKRGRKVNLVTASQAVNPTMAPTPFCKDVKTFIPLFDQPQEEFEVGGDIVFFTKFVKITFHPEALLKAD